MNLRTNTACITAADFAGDKPIVVLAPHPDDESLGCGAVLSAAFGRAGAHVICMTDGSASHPGSSDWPPARLAQLRREELGAAMTALGGGAGDLTWLGYGDTALGDADPRHIAQRIAEICHRIGADRLIATSPLDHHTDHKATAAIAEHVVTLCPWMGLFFYPVWSRWDDPDFCEKHADWRLVRVDASESRRVKLQAINAHHSQRGLIISDTEGFCLAPEMIRRFADEDELYFEVKQCL
jgi:LmbE family N-acetylglucosaminyl deacetylase